MCLISQTNSFFNIYNTRQAYPSLQYIYKYSTWHIHIYIHTFCGDTRVVVWNITNFCFLVFCCWKEDLGSGGAFWEIHNTYACTTLVCGNKNNTELRTKADWRLSVDYNGSHLGFGIQPTHQWWLCTFSLSVRTSLKQSNSEAFWLVTCNCLAYFNLRSNSSSTQQCSIWSAIPNLLSTQICPCLPIPANILSGNLYLLSKSYSV